MFRETRALFLGTLLLFANQNISAQCPIAASCTPGTATQGGQGFNAGIFRVTLNTINKSTSGDVDGYKDYSCTDKTSITVGTNYNISIQTGSLLDEKVRVWIDINNDGTFSTGELVFSSNTGKLHTGTINLPGSTTLNTLLRMRVSADYVGSPTPTACSTPEYSQVEDYGVTALENLNKPDANFEANKTIVCSGNVQFTDLSNNAPTAWKWYFGDGDSSSLQNPSHIYFATGIYSVTLIASNANGSDTFNIPNYITYHDTIPKSACAPITSNYCCGYGIYNVTLENINNTTADGSAGYENFTCTHRVRLTEGINYPISITTGSAQNQTTKIWVDMNDDGIFQNSEIIFTAPDTKNPSGNLLIPGGSVKNKPVRMRIVSDYAASSFDACFNIQHGQAEDYTVIILQNTNIPVADFFTAKPVGCDSIFQFVDQSLNTPNAWLWNFGDGQTSTDQNPIHEYVNPGVYTVTLIAINDFGADTFERVDYISVSRTPTKNCEPGTIAHCCNGGITLFKFGTINNISSNGFAGYQDFSCNTITTLQSGKTYPIQVRTSNQVVENVIAWIDLDDNGEFDNDSEIIFTSRTILNHMGNVTLPKASVYNKALRLRVTSDRSISPIPAPCDDVFIGQHEDYAIILTEPDSTDFVAEKMLENLISVSPNPAANMIYFSAPQSVKVNAVSIINTLGTEVLKTANFYNSEINISSLKSGLYLLKFELNEGTVIKKVHIKNE